MSNELKMPYINSVAIAGRLTADPDIREVKNGSSLCAFRIACNKVRIVNGEKKEYPTFIRVIYFREKEAIDNLARLLAKGKPVYVEGELSTSEFEKEGERRSTLEIRANKIQLLTWDSDRRPEIIYV